MALRTCKECGAKIPKKQDNAFRRCYKCLERYFGPRP